MLASLLSLSLSFTSISGGSGNQIRRPKTPRSNDRTSSPNSQIHKIPRSRHHIREGGHDAGRIGRDIGSDSKETQKSTD